MATDNDRSDLQKVLDAIKLSTDYTSAVSGNKDALERLKAIEELPEDIKKWVDAQPAEGATGGGGGGGGGNGGAGGGGEVDKTVKPKREAFPEGDEGDVEFAKALVRWDTASKAIKSTDRLFKKPVREDYFTDEEFNKANTAYSGLVEEISKSVLERTIEGTEVKVGEAIKKSMAIPAGGADKFTFKGIFDDSADTRSARELLRKEGLPYA